MESLMMENDKYEKIIDFICTYKKIDKTQLFRLLKDKECKYLLLLLLEKYKCTDIQKLTEVFSVHSTKSIRYNLKKAEEKFFVNRNFREWYFEIEEMIEKII